MEKWLKRKGHQMLTNAPFVSEEEKGEGVGEQGKEHRAKSEIFEEKSWTVPFRTKVKRKLKKVALSQTSFCHEYFISC